MFNSLDPKLEGAYTMRHATKLKLSLEMIFIAAFHIGVLFIVYGKKWLAHLAGWPIVNPAYVWLLLPSCGAFVLYYFSLSRANFFGDPFRRGKLTASSLAATLFSLYWGVFFSFNTYGT
jgi:hypothetical protein